MDTSLSVDKVVTSEEMSAVEDVVAATSSEKLVVGCCSALVFSVEMSTTSDAVVTNLEVDIPDVAGILSEEMIISESNVTSDEMRGIGVGDVATVITSTSGISAEIVITFDGMLNIGVLVVTSSADIIVEGMVVSVLGNSVVSILAVDIA